MKFETSHEGIPQELKALRQWVAWWSVAGQGVPVALPNSRPTRPLEPRPKPHKLPINAATGGLAMANNRSRIKLVPFDVSFEGREDRGLKAAMKTELPGVLAWAVERCLRWQEDGLCFPDTVRDATARWRGENDQVGQFLEERCVRGEYATVRVRKLYTAYRRWAEEIGEDVMTERAFGERMLAQGFERKHREDGNWYLGVGLTAEAG